MSSQNKRIRKAVFPVAGLGTRFLPATKAMPKEMLTVVDRPVIQHVVDEAKAAGIEHFIFVTGRNKGVIEDHFDSQFELERTLAERGKTEGARSAHARAAGRRARPASPASRRRSVLDTPCGARARSSATSRSPCCCPTCCTMRRAALPRRDDRGLRGARRQPHGGRAGAGRPDAPIRYRRRGGRQGQGVAHHADGGEAQGRHGAVQSAHLRPLHPAARDFRQSWRARSAAPAARSSSPTP